MKAPGEVTWWHSKQLHHARELTSYPAVYNTLRGGGHGLCTATSRTTLRRMVAVIRCPECSAEIDVDEDEVEEGETPELSRV